MRSTEKEKHKPAPLYKLGGTVVCGVSPTERFDEGHQTPFRVSVLLGARILLPSPQELLVVVKRHKDPVHEHKACEERKRWSLAVSECGEDISFVVRAPSSVLSPPREECTSGSEESHGTTLT